jgi:predicted dehydrogenase
MMHLPTLAERPDLFRIAGLAEVSRATLDAVGDRYGVAFRTTDQRELIARADVDAVLVLASGSHREAALAALGAGKHLFSEKPLGFSLAETEEIARAASRSRSVLMVGYHKRFDPAYRKAAELVRSLSDLRFVEVTVLHPDDGAYRTHHAVLPPRQPQPPSPEEVGNRALVEELRSKDYASCLESALGRRAPVELQVAVLLLYQSLVHDTNAVRGILGEPEAVVSAEVWRGGFAQTSLTRFPRDVRVAMSWISLPGLKHYEERLRFVSPEARVTLVFPSPYLRHAPTPLTVERMDGGELVVEERTVSYEEAFRAELHHFRECVLEKREPETGVEDALGDARWIQAIARALAARAGAPRARPAGRSAAPGPRRGRSASPRSRRRS